MPSTDWKENVASDEDERFERYAQQLRALQRKRATNGKAARALHAKSHVGVVARLEIGADLPANARFGLFARPVTYDCYARFSNGAPVTQHDKKGDVRALALKVRGVDGAKVLGDARTQDFLLVQSSVTPFRGPDEFVAFVRAAATPALLPIKLFAWVGFGRTLDILRRLAGGPVSKPVASMATLRLFSAAPIRLGPYAARYALRPLQTADEPPPEGEPGYLAADLARRLREGPLAWDMELQFYEDAQRTPIEDASAEWDAPYVTVARLTIPKQDVASDEGKATAALVESLSFDPWHALVEHRPLGAMMRARKHAYYASTQERGSAAEPT
jgi:hypothetical protein